MKRYCVIGAGPAGLAMARALDQAGVDFVVYERLPDIGGIWDISNPQTPVYENTHFISSARMSAFEHFPMPADYPDYPRHDQVLAYLRAFARDFELLGHVVCDTEVACVRATGGAWEVERHDGVVERFAGVILATGHNWQSNVPELPGKFAGEALHSREYFSSSRMRAKRVLVVGGGNSACDIACDIREVATSVSLSLRRGYYFIPKYIFDTPADELAQSGQTSRPAFSMMLSMLVKTLEGHGVPRPTHRLFEANPVVNTQIIEAIASGAVTVEPDIRRLSGDRVEFVDGTQKPFEAIVYATGFKYDLPELHDIVAWRAGRPDLVLNTFSPAHPGLYILGLFETDGGAFPILSLQAKMVARMISALDSSAADAGWIADVAGQHADLAGGRDYVKSERHAISVNRRAFMQALGSTAESLTPTVRS